MPLLISIVSGIAAIAVGVAGYFLWHYVDWLVFLLIALGDTLVVSAVVGASVERVLADRTIGEIGRAAAGLYEEKFFVARFGREVWEILRPSVTEIAPFMIYETCDWHLDLTLESSSSMVEVRLTQAYKVRNTSGISRSYPFAHFSTSTPSPGNRSEIHSMMVDGQSIDINNPAQATVTSQVVKGKTITMLSGTLDLPPNGAHDVRVLRWERQESTGNRVLATPLPTRRFNVTVTCPDSLTVSFHYVQSMHGVDEKVDVPFGTAERVSTLSAANIFPYTSFQVEWCPRPATAQPNTPEVKQ